MSVNIVYDESVFKSDLDAFGIAIKEKDFREAIIYGNRIMSNAYLSEAKDFGIIGFILRQIGTDGIALQQIRDQAISSEFSNRSSKIVGRIITMLAQGKLDLNEIWMKYSEHQISTRSMFLSKTEKIAYVKLDKSFSKSIVKQLMKTLSENREFLLYPTNNVLRGLLTEVGRISKVHGLENSDEHFVSLLIMLEKIDEYVKGTSLQGDFKNRSEKELMPLLNKILELYDSITDEDPKEKAIDDLLWNMIKEWRLYFIKFMEVSQSNFSIKEERTMTDKQEKSKLINEVTKQIEEDLGA